MVEQPEQAPISVVVRSSWIVRLHTGLAAFACAALIFAAGAFAGEYAATHHQPCFSGCVDMQHATLTMNVYQANGTRTETCSTATNDNCTVPQGVFG